MDMTTMKMQGMTEEISYGEEGDHATDVVVEPTNK